MFFFQIQVWIRILYLSFQVEFCFFASFDDPIPDNDLIYIILISFVFSFRKVFFSQSGTTTWFMIIRTNADATYKIEKV